MGVHCADVLTAWVVIQLAQVVVMVTSAESMTIVTTTRLAWASVARILAQDRVVRVHTVKLKNIILSASATKDYLEIHWSYVHHKAMSLHAAIHLLAFQALVVITPNVQLAEIELYARVFRLI